MGKWRYCECGEGFDFPTAEEAFSSSVQVCDHCGKENPVPESDRHHVIVELLEKVQEMELKISSLESRVSRMSWHIRGGG